MTRSTPGRLVAAFLACIAASPLTAAAPPAADVPASQVPGETRAMRFRMVEGRGVFGLTRWIQASGHIEADTPQRFREFARTHDVRGLTVALDSHGGFALGSLNLGRAFRELGVNTTVGRTVLHFEDGRPVASLVTNLVECNSACTYAFVGGVRRRISDRVVLGVHQFNSWGLAREQDYQRAQSFSGEIAVYLQEMGIDLRFLEITARHPFEQMHALTPAEIRELHLASLVRGAEGDVPPAAWAVSSGAQAATLHRRLIRQDSAERRIDHEVTMMCARDPAVVYLQLRIILVRTAAAGAPVGVTATRIDFGERDLPWRSPLAHQPLARRSGDSLSLGFMIQSNDLSEAVRLGRLSVELTDLAGTIERTDLADGLPRAHAAFQAQCDAQRRLEAQAG